MDDRRENNQMRAGKVDHVTLYLTFVLLGLGLIALYSASFPVAYFSSSIDNPAYYVLRQGGFAVLGLIAMFAATKFQYHWLHIVNIPLAIISLALLAATPFVGVTSNNATRWINIAGIQFQPSELVKTAVIISFSCFACMLGNKMRNLFTGVLPFVAVLGVIAVLLDMQPHLSATVIIAGTGLCIIFAAGIRLWYVFPVGALGAYGVYYFLQNNSYAMDRINVWLDPFIDPLDTGYQAIQSHLAIGSGGFWGVGFCMSRQKYLYLPEPQNDFIFSVWCEELGFIGGLVVVLLFAALIIRGFQIALNARDKLGMLLAVGITAKLGIQVIVNICVVTGIFPVTGASLPFFSYGGTALALQLGEIGILLNVSRYKKTSKNDE